MVKPQTKRKAVVMVEQPKCHVCKLARCGLFVKEDVWWCVDCMYAELQTLRDTVGKLPKTADDKPITDHTVTYCKHGHPHYWRIRGRNGQTPEEHGEKQYSTREAAARAAGGE